MKIHKTPTLLFLQKRACSVIVEDPGKGQMGPRGGNQRCRSWAASNCDSILPAPSWGPHAHSNIGSVGSCRRRSPGSSGQRKVRLLLSRLLSFSLPPRGGCSAGRQQAVEKATLLGDSGRSWRRDRSWAQGLELVQIRSAEGSRSGSIPGGQTPRKEIKRNPWEEWSHLLSSRLSLFRRGCVHAG